MKALGFEGEKNSEGLMSPDPHALPRDAVGPLEQRRLVDDGDDRPRDEIPPFRELDRDDRLHVENPQRRVLRARVEVEIVLERDAMRSATGFCVFLDSSVSSSSASTGGAAVRINAAIGTRDGLQAARPTRWPIHDPFAISLFTPPAASRSATSSA
ncbi:MAG TPA: hypothetical protein VKD72_10195 [Gemmataceae bacterium]|nr:hypothetical protein [Gemmataceae bacterium]